MKIFALTLYPNIEWRCLLASRSTVAAWRGLVDVVLGHRGAHHRNRGEEEAECDLLDSRELDTGFTESRVDHKVHDWDHDHQSDGVEVVDEVC